MKRESAPATNPVREAAVKAERDLADTYDDNAHAAKGARP